MGKSAGKWIKTVLFGKKSSKSSLSKNVTPDKKTAPKTPAEDLSGISPVISDPCQVTDIAPENLELEKGTSFSPSDAITLSPVNHGTDSQSATASFPINDAEMRKQEEAATKAQAAFRGYLARRAFRALKGIIRLQALIRGHLVRRQAVATLRCMHAIVKFQALARGRKVRISDSSHAVGKKYSIGDIQDAKQVQAGASLFFGSEKLATNTFVRKLLLTLPNAMHLSLQYDTAEPNSAWNWLERWSLSHFWVPPARIKKAVKPKPQRKQHEFEPAKSKRTIRKVPTGTSNVENGASETDKPKRNPRKVTNNHTDAATQEQAQNELERVKRNLRKVSASAAAAASASASASALASAAAAAAAAVPEKLEPEVEKPQSPQNVEIATISTPPDIPEDEIVISSEKSVEPDAVVDKQFETPSKPIVNDPVDAPPSEDHSPAVEAHSSENGVKIDNSLGFDDELGCKEGQNNKENHKTKKRRSLPSNKQEYTENVSQNSPSLPSYMAATESAKAKLRAQGSPKIADDVAENGGYARRHSLPASTNGKLSSLSPRIQKPVQANGKGGSKSNRSLTASRDDKALPGWRR